MFLWENVNLIFLRVSPVGQADLHLLHSQGGGSILELLVLMSPPPEHWRCRCTLPVCVMLGVEPKA